MLGTFIYFQIKTLIFRPRSPDRAITRVVAELNTFAEKWCFSKPEVANFGSDIKLKEINSYQLIQEFTRLSEKLLKDDEYPCKKCPHFDNHVSFDKIIYKLNSFSLLVS